MARRNRFARHTSLRGTMFRSLCLCSCLVLLVDGAVLRDTNKITPEAKNNFGCKTGDGSARTEAGGLVQGQLQVAGKYHYTGTDGKIYAVTYRADTESDGYQTEPPPSSSAAPEEMKLQNSEVAPQIQHQNGTVMQTQKISETNQKGPAGGTNEEDDELVGDKIGSACLACLAGGGLG